MYRFILLLFPVLLFSLHLDGQALTQADSLLKIECEESHRLLHDGNFQELILRIEQGGQVDCYGIRKPGRAGQGGKWYPGKILVRVLDGLFRRRGGGTPYTLLSEAIQMEQSTSRDQLILLLLKKTPKLSYHIMWWNLYLENTSNRNSPETLRALFSRFDYSTQRITLSTAFRSGFKEYIELFMEKHGQQKAKHELAAYSFAHDVFFFNAHLDKVGVYPKNPKGIRAEFLLSSSPINNHKFTPVNPHLIKEEDWARLILNLKNRGASFKYKDANQQNLVFQAVSVKNLGLAKALQENLDWNLSETDKNGQNLLHLAAITQSGKIIEWAKGFGIPLTQKDNTGKVPADYLEDWNIVQRDVMGGNLNEEERNTLTIYQIALKPEAKYTEADKVFIEKLNSKMPFKFEVSIKTREDRAFPSRQKLVTLANDNGSWPLFAKLSNLLPKDDYVSYSEANRQNLAASNWDYFRGMFRSRKEVLAWFRGEVMDKYQNLKGPNPKADEMLLVLLNDGYEWKEMNGKTDYFDAWDRPLIPETHDEILPFDKRPITLFKRSGKWGIISLNNKEIVPPIYESMKSVAENFGSFGKEYYYEVSFDGNRKLISVQHFLSLSQKKEVNLPEETIARYEFVKDDIYLHTTSGSKKGLAIIDYKTLKEYLPCMYEEITLIGEKTFYRYYKVKKNGIYAWYRTGMNPWDLKFKYDDVRFDPNSQKISVLRKGKWKEI